MVVRGNRARQGRPQPITQLLHLLQATPKVFASKQSPSLKAFAAERGVFFFEGPRVGPLKSNPIHLIWFALC